MAVKKLVLLTVLFCSVATSSAWAHRDDSDDNDGPPRTAAEIRQDLRNGIRSRAVESIGSLLALRCKSDDLLVAPEGSAISSEAADRIEACAGRIEQFLLSHRPQFNKTFGTNALTPRVIKQVVRDFIADHQASAPDDNGDLPDEIVN